MLHRDEIGDILREEVQRARRVYEVAHAHFSSVTTDIPSHLPSPDGTDRIRNAGKAYRATMDAYSAALKEFNDFLTSGVVPERLKNSPEQKKASRFN